MAWFLLPNTCVDFPSVTHLIRVLLSLALSLFRSSSATYRNLQTSHYDMSEDNNLGLLGYVEVLFNCSIWLASSGVIVGDGCFYFGLSGKRFCDALYNEAQNVSPPIMR